MPALMLEIPADAIDRALDLYIERFGEEEGAKRFVAAMTRFRTKYLSLLGLSEEGLT